MNLDEICLDYARNNGFMPNSRKKLFFAKCYVVSLEFRHYKWQQALSI